MELATTARQASAAIARLGGKPGKEIWVEGKVDPDARGFLEGRGWVVMEGVGLTARGMAQRRASD